MSKGTDQVDTQVAELSRQVAELQAMTDRYQQIQQEVTENQQRFEAFSEASFEGIAITEQGRIVDVNPWFCALLGYARDELIGREVVTLVAPEDRDGVIEKIRSGYEQPYEHRAVRKDGSIIDVEVCGRTVQYQGRECRVTAVHDVTHRNQAAEALREERSFTSGLIKSSIDGILAFDTNFHYTVWNPEMERMSGVPKDEVMGRCAFDVFPFLLATGEDEFFRKALAGEVTIAKDRPYVVPATGREGFFDGHYCPLRSESGQIQGGLAIIRDITERKGAEEALRESESRFRELVENIREVFWMENADGSELLYVSPAFEQVWGRPCEDFYKDPQLWVEVIHPDDRQRVVDAFGQLRSAGTYAEEFRITRPDGSIRWIWDRGSLIRDAAGEIQRVLGIAEDITERREAEQERLALEAQVQHSQKLESLGVLAGGIAHDFNNLLVAIVGNADMALWDLPEDSNVRSSVGEIKQAAMRAAELANQMLAYSGKGRFVVAPLDLNAVITEMGHLLGASIAKKVALRYCLAPDLPSIEADAVQLRQVVMNLITNASEAIGDADGTVVLRTGVMQVNRAYLATTQVGADLPEGCYVCIEVTDTGHGMDGETLSRLFEPFFTTKFTGRGLGMAAVLGIVRGHNGAIRVESEVGMGTTFSVLLPCSDLAVQPLPAETGLASALTWRGSGTILVVDDEPSVARMTQMLLMRLGFDVLTAADGVEAVEICRREGDGLAAILLDMTMPRMSGEEAFAELRRMQPDLPIFLCSGYAEEDATQRFTGKGLAGFLHKPFGLRELAKTIRRGLEP